MRLMKNIWENLNGYVSVIAEKKQLLTATICALIIQNLVVVITKKSLNKDLRPTGFQQQEFIKYTSALKKGAITKIIGSFIYTVVEA